MIKIQKYQLSQSKYYARIITRLGFAGQDMEPVACAHIMAFWHFTGPGRNILTINSAAAWKKSLVKVRQGREHMFDACLVSNCQIIRSAFLREENKFEKHDAEKT